jgi:hypothetical protein
MNIFVIDPENIKYNAEMLDDKRVVKMVLESAQLLASAVVMSGGKATYKLTHKNHPCSIWAREHRGNYTWLLELFKHLCVEYSYRFNKVHKCEQYLKEFEDGQFYLDDQKMFDPHPNCTIFKNKPIYEAYRLCMAEKWNNDKRQPKWTNRTKPIL